MEISWTIQFVYKPGHSIKLLYCQLKMRYNSLWHRVNPCSIVLLDLLAAFDSIDHNTLLGYLKFWFGLGGTVLKGLVSYLSNHCQDIKIGFTLSEQSKLIYEVPQESLLGPLLFSLCTTPRMYTSQKCFCCSYQAECLSTVTTMVDGSS